jgi:urease gamma subunit
MTTLRRTPLADILSRHDLRTATGLALCIEEAVAAFDAEVLDGPVDVQTGEELSPESPTGDHYNEILDLVATVVHQAKSARSEHWLAGVEAVLAAETGDLRELAILAGGDPQTFYIGTPLAGADLRGQDLRGMILPDLDPRRVRHDSKTIFPDGSRGGHHRRLVDLVRPLKRDRGGKGR